MNAPISKSQARAMELAGIQLPEGDWTTYAQAATALQAANLPHDGLPTGHTWRSAAKLSDSDLMAALVATINARYDMPDHDAVGPLVVR